MNNFYDKKTDLLEISIVILSIYLYVKMPDLRDQLKISLTLKYFLK